MQPREVKVMFNRPGVRGSNRQDAVNTRKDRILRYNNARLIFILLLSLRVLKCFFLVLITYHNYSHLAEVSARYRQPGSPAALRPSSPPARPPGGRAVERRTVNRGDGGSIPPTAVSKLRQFLHPTFACVFRKRH